MFPHCIGHWGALGGFRWRCRSSVSASAGTGEHRQPGGGGRRLAAWVLPLLVLAAMALMGPGLSRAFNRATVTVPVAAVTGGAPNAGPGALASAAADLLAQTTAKGGTGYRFEIVQRSTLVAKDGGPKVQVPDPADRTKTLGEADRYEVASLVETGFVIPAGFSMEMRSGPAGPDATGGAVAPLPSSAPDATIAPTTGPSSGSEGASVAPGTGSASGGAPSDAPDAAPLDLTAGDLLFRALVRDGKTYRDDGKGWYPTTQPPGVGLDPVTASRLPDLLRNGQSPADVAIATAEGDLGKTDPAATRAIAATSKVADIPGAIAVDGAPFTELTEPVGMTFDAAGRLVGLLVTARNTTVATYDFVVVTEITLHYDDIPQVLPLPEPAWTNADQQQVVK